MGIREATEKDWGQIWPIFSKVTAAGDIFGYDINMPEQQAKEIWLQAPRKTFVFEEDGVVLATYYIKTNQAGPGRHVCTCEYMVSPIAIGRGLSTHMCKHSQQYALELGYKAMIFNFVASSNTGAVRLWKSLGFEIVGCMQRAFLHPSDGFCDAFVMYKWLEHG